MAVEELRPTGNYERFNITRNHLRVYNNIAITASYLVPRALLPSVTNNSFQPLIYAVLAKVVARHPALGICIADEGSKEPKWRRVEQIDLGEIVKFIDVDGEDVVTDRWLQAEHRVRMERTEELPLWRVVVSRNLNAGSGPKSEDGGDVFFGVAIFLHHAVGDGVSGGAFHVSFLEALNDLIDEKELGISETQIFSPPPVPLLPSLELATPLPITIWYLIKQVFAAYVYSPPRPLHWTGPAVLESPVRPPICHVRSFIIPRALATALVAACRREKTTVTALVTALVARHMAEMYPSHSRFKATVPFSMRKFTSISAKEIVLYISSVVSDFSSESPVPRGYIACGTASDLWKSARECKAHITSATESNTNQIVGMTGYISDMPKFFESKLGSKRQHAFEVTNIGVVDGNANDMTKARFDRIQLSTGLGTVAAPYELCLATAKDGDMNFSLGWEDGVVEDERAVGLSTGLEKSLRELISGGKTVG